MEANITCPISIEFYGLPGCGKSTISHRFADEMREMGLRIWEPSFDIDRKFTPSIRKVVKLSKMIMLAIQHPCLYRKMSALVKYNGYSGVEAISQKTNLAYKILAYCSPKDCNVMVWDEGILQSSVSLAMGNKVSSGENENVISGMCGGIPIYKVLTYVDCDNALKRMEGRSTNDSRVEQLTERGQQLEFLHLFEAGVNAISNIEDGGFVGFIKLDTVNLNQEQVSAVLWESFVNEHK